MEKARFALSKRSRRSKNIFELLEEKGFEAITIKDITEKAQLTVARYTLLP